MLQNKFEEDDGEVRMDMRRALVSRRGGGAYKVARNRRNLAAEERSSNEKSQ
jgi:hypothetical protein